MFKTTIATIIVCTVGIILLTNGLIGLIDYIVFSDEKPEYNYLVTLYLLAGISIISVGSAYVLRERRKNPELDD